ncbi:MAG: membrane protein insertion efficiency factor YidD [Omnitrophica bacterium]|nr:membrane protein insertion efficiency factor YidD [Candidatus Omnitrophota bacterium]
MRKLALFLLNIYRRIPAALPASGHCIYTPTCSKYAQEAFLKYSFWKALIRIFCRLLRCNPFSPGGPDPLK